MNLEDIKKVVKSGHINSRDIYGNTLLHHMTRCNSDFISYLIDSGAKLNEKNNDGDTPLMIAIKHESNRCVKILIKAGADIHIRNNCGHQAIHEFCDQGEDIETLKLLLDNGAEVNSKNGYGRNSLHHATLSYGEKSMDVMKILFEKGVNINEEDNEYKTPLFFAFGKGNSIFRQRFYEKGYELIRRGASHTNSRGENFLDKIDDEERKKVEKFIEEHRGLDIKEPSDD